MTQKVSTPSNISHIAIIARYELLNHIRSRRFLLLLVVILAAGIGSTAFISYIHPTSMLSSPITFYGGWLGFTITYIIILPAVFFGSDAISSEFQNKTAYSMIGNPILRSSIYIGKVVAAFVASLCMLSVFEFITLGNGLYYFGFSVPIQFWESFALAVLLMAASLGIAFLLSTLFKNAAISVLFSAATLLFGFSLLERLLERLQAGETWYILSYAGQCVVNVFSIPYPPHVITNGTETAYFATIPEGIAIMAGYLVVSLLIGYLIFKGRDLT